MNLTFTKLDFWDWGQLVSLFRTKYFSYQLSLNFSRVKKRTRDRHTCSWLEVQIPHERTEIRSICFSVGVITFILLEEFKCLAPNFAGRAKRFLHEQLYFCFNMYAVELTKL